MRLNARNIVAWNVRELLSALKHMVNTCEPARGSESTDHLDSILSLDRDAPAFLSQCFES
jgi:hypothetical protein